MFLQHGQLISKTPRLSILFGGGQSGITKYLYMAGKVVIIGDSPEELAKLNIRERPGQRVFMFPVGKTQTLADLLANASPEMKQLAKERPIPLNAGAGQLRLIGGHLAQALVESREFNSVLHDEILPHLITEHGGRVSDIVVELLFSLGGGMGSEGAKIIGLYVANELVKAYGWLIDLEFNAVGAISYVGLGKGIIRNSSASNAEFVLLATTPPENARISVSYVTGELLASGHDAATREMYVAERAMALTCEQVRAKLRMVRPNKAAHSECGNCRMLEVTRYKHIPSEKITAQLAGQLLPFIDSLRRVVPDLSVISSLAFHVLSESLPRESTASIISRADLVPYEEFQDSVCRPGAAHSITVKAETLDGVPLDLTAARTTFGAPLTTSEQTQERLVWLKTSQVLIRRNTKSLGQEFQALQTAQSKLLRQLHLAFAIFTQQRRGLAHFWSFAATLLAIILTDDAKQRWLEDSILKVRENLDAQALIYAKLEALRSASTGVLQEEEAIEKSLAILWTGLEDLRPKGEFARTPNYVTAGPLENAWAELLHLNARDAKRQLLDLLPTTVQYVTLDGLAAIVDAADARVDEVLRAMRSKHAATLGPPFGGFERIDAGIQILVLPPCDPVLQAKLFDEFPKNDRETLAFADCAPSVNAVGLRVYFAESREELFPKMYRQGLEAAAESPGYLSDRTVIDALGFNQHTNGSLPN